MKKNNISGYLYFELNFADSGMDRIFSQSEIVKCKINNLKNVPDADAHDELLDIELRLKEISAIATYWSQVMHDIRG